jgi:fatty acid desaturase
VETFPLSYYAKAVRPSLPKHAFDAVPSRLAWLLLHVGIVAGSITALAHHVGGWWAAPLWSLLIGLSFGGGAFVGHEAMHGAVVRNRLVRHLVGFVSFLPFNLSPRLWVAWHNKTHHGNTMRDGVDPDAFPTLETYRVSWGARIADKLALAHARPLGFFTLLLGFTGQSTQMLLNWARSTDAIPRAEKRLIAVEVVLAWSTWLAVAWYLGPLLFVFGYVIPLMIGNAIVMSYILTNHNLSPLTEVNDPLVNSLSVEVPAFVHRVHLHFGLHVEHHLFPSMSSAYAPLVRDVLREKFPDRYQSLPLLTALHRLMTTPRVYGSATTLVDPIDGTKAETLQPTLPAAITQAA